MLSLADAPPTVSAETFNTALTSGGIICAFLVVATVLLIIVHKAVIGPELRDSRTARTQEQQATAKISADFAISTQNLKETLAMANEMHERCRAREHESRA